MNGKLFSVPKMVEDAKSAKKGLNWLLEILLFVAVFFVCNIGIALLLVAGEFIVIFNNADYVNAVKAGNELLASVYLNNILSGDMFLIITLICEIAMIGLTLLFCKLIQKRKMSTLGFVKKGMVKEYLIGLAVGFGIFSAGVLIAVVTGSIKINGISATCSLGILISYAIGFMIQGMAEEVLCRGYFMVSYARKHSVISAILINSVVFAALHLTNSGIDLLSFINLVLFGIFASVYFLRRGSIWGIGALHSVWNFAQGNFYGIKVSGMNIRTSVLDTTEVAGMEIFNGGAFGLEGSICVTIVLLAGIVIMYLQKEKQ